MFVCMHACCCDCVLVLHFVMVYVLQSGETAHKREHFYYPQHTNMITLVISLLFTIFCAPSHFIG